VPSSPLHGKHRLLIPCFLPQQPPWLEMATLFHM
jgi:hypothetical protein